MGLLKRQQARLQLRPSEDMTDSTDGCIFRTSPAHETQPFYVFLGLDGVAANSWIWFCLYSILLFIFCPSTFFSLYFPFPFFSTRSPIASWKNPAIDLTQPMSTFRLQCIYCKLFLSVVLVAHVVRKDLFKGKKKNAAEHFQILGLVVHEKS